MRVSLGLITAALLLSGSRLFAAITGEVISSEGNPLEKVTVSVHARETWSARMKRLLSDKPGKTPLAKATTDAHGRFILDGVKESSVDVQFELDGFAPLGKQATPDSNLGILALHPVKTKTGKVLADGKPVKDATVIWTGATAGEISVRTDASGTYTIPDPSGWSEMLIVLHPAYAPFFAQGAGDYVRQGAPLVHSLTKGARVRGRVTGIAGKDGAAGAQIRVDGFSYGVTKADGTFEILHVHDSFATITASLDGMIGVAKKTKDLWSIVLEKSASVQGTVRDAAKKQPISGALVRIWGRDAQGLTEAFTDSRGRFHLTGLAPSRYSVMAMADGFQREQMSDDDSTLDLREKRSGQKDLTLRALVRIAGRVEDESKKPVRGVLVTSRDIDPRIYGAAADQWGSYTDQNGKFEVPVYTPEGDEKEKSMQLVARKKGFPPASSIAFSPKERRAREAVLITLRAGVPLSGEVRDADNNPVPAAMIVVREKTFEQEQTGPQLEHLIRLATPEGTDRADSAGRFTIPLTEGEYDLAFKADGFAWTKMKGVKLTARSEPVKVVLRRGVEILGKVIRADKTGIGDVMIAIEAEGSMSRPISSQPDGSFVIRDLEPGVYKLRLFHDEELVFETRTVTAPVKDLIVEIEPRGTLSGRVLDASSRQPVSGFHVTVEKVGGAQDEPSYIPPKSIQDEKGEFRLSNIPLGSLKVTVMAPGYVSGIVESVTAAADSAAAPLEILLSRGLVLTGRVSSPEGTPVEDVMVDAADSDPASMYLMPDMQSGNRTTDQKGEYRIEGLSPGSRRITFRRDGYVAKHESVTLVENQTLDVTLSRGLTLKGIVSTDDGPVDGAMVSVSSAVVNAESQSAKSDEAGGFTITELLPGRYKVSASKTGFGDAELKDVDAATAGTVRLLLEKKRAAKISGTVLGLPKNEIMHWVTARSESGHVAVGIDESGRYTINDAPTGTVRLTATLQLASITRNSKTERVEVAPGSDIKVDLHFSSDVVIRGQVHRDGVPLFGAIVTFRSVSVKGSTMTTTDANGGYEIVGLEPDRYVVSVESDEMQSEYKTTTLIRESGQFDITIRSGAIRGKVINEVTGAPLSDVLIKIVRTDAHGATVLHSGTEARTDGKGEFVVASLSEGTYRAVANKEHFGQELRDFSLAGSSSEMLLFNLVPADGVSVKLVDARDRRPLDGIIIARDLQRRVVFNHGAKVQSDGSSLISLAPGDYLISASATGYASQTIRVKSPSRGVELPLTPGGTLVITSALGRRGTVKLMLPDGEEYVRCWCNGIAEISIRGKRTLVENVAPGAYTMRVLDFEGALVAAQPAMVGEGQTTTVNID